MFQTIFAYVAADPKIQATIYSVVSSTLLAIVGKLLSARARLRWGRVHYNHFMIKNKDGGLSAVVTANYTISNTGRAAAKEIEVSFNWEPEHYEVWPHKEYSTSKREDGRFIIKVPRINIAESVNIAIINAGNTAPDLTYIGHNEGSVKEIPIFPQRVWPQKVAYASAALMLVGLMTILYWIFRGIIAVF
ncbi:hypothetical protein [Hansschlegelia plantiphila]|uniref:Uncharacterized protein n=1 Tax=Hansschlegelia plantiphila TaxID=374655 RepID=A0A9W6J070_9HYPH|nr:hypothetical protein [Hansschlegelia plantiphila]GLK67024.1 hypothetical protein GCM10008179_06620 [Hansschlegelia plantiphila]